jgi:hypothetical protein
MALLKFKRSAVPAKVPALNDLALGELAINTYDGKVYTKKDDGTPAIVEIGGNSSGITTITSTDGSVTVTGSGATRDLSVAVAGSTTNVLALVRNNTGATLAKGTVVYINGSLGQNSTVAKAIATSDATSAQTLGLMTANLANNATGYVTVIGVLTGMNTSAFSDGQQLYLSPTTAGTFTATKPYAPNHMVYVAVVEHAHPTQGKLFVKVQNGYEMDELHDVSAQNPANNDGLFYNTTSGLWEKKSIATALGYTPVNRAGDTMTGNLTVNNTVTAAILGSTAYNTPSLLRPIVGDDNWAFGGFQSAEQYWMQVQFYGVGDDNRGFRVLDKNGGTVRFRVNGAGDAYASNAFRAPIYYDSPNSAYYIDPAGTSNLSGVTLDGTLTGVTGRFAKNQTAGNYTTAALWTESYGNTATGIAFHISGVVGKFLEMRTDGILYWQGTMNADSELRASVFRDSVNSAYFLDPDSTSVLNVVRPNIIQSSNGNTAIVLDSTTWTQFADPNGGTKLWLGGTADPNNYYNAGIHFFRNTSSGVTMTIDNAGNAIATSSFRAPIFYDTPNTAFYVDPSETSNLNFLNVSGSSVYRSDWTTRFQSPSDFVDGTLVTTDIPATGWAGDSFVIEITGKSYDQNNPPFKVVAQGYLYNDTIINYSGISYAGNFASYIKVFQDGGVLKFWWPRISYWNSFNVNVMSMDGQTNGTITRNRVTAIGNSTEPTGTKKQQINLIKFLRSTETAAKATDLNQERYVNNDFNTLGTSPQVFRAYTNYIPSGGSYNQPTGGGQDFKVLQWGDVQGGTSGNWGGQIVQNFYDDRMWFRRSYGTTWQAWREFIHDGNVGSFAMRTDASATNSVDIRAPIFYDNPNTAYYLDPAGNSVLGTASFGETTGSNTGISVISSTGGYGRIRYLEGGTNQHTIHFFSSGWSGSIETSGNSINLGAAGAVTMGPWNAPWEIVGPSYAQHNTTYRAPIFRDSNNTAYYVDPDGTSNLYQITGPVTYGSYGSISISGSLNGYAGIAFPAAACTLMMGNGSSTPAGFYFGNSAWGMYCYSNAGIYTHIMYDLDDSAYRVDPTGTSALSTVTFGSNHTIGGGGGRIIPSTGSPYSLRQEFGSDNTGWRYGIAKNVSGSVTVLFYVQDNGDCVATGNITAYSDIRIKANVETIPNALDKLGQIRGVTYTRTDMDDNERRYAGVIAQEIEAVLPEAVGGDENAKTVDYNATIALLIEAVKELSLKVKTLEEKDN